MYPLATPPMGIMYLAGYLKREIENVEIKLINQKVKNDTPEELAKKYIIFHQILLAYHHLQFLQV